MLSYNIINVNCCEKLKTDNDIAVSSIYTSFGYAYQKETKLYDFQSVLIGLFCFSPL